MLDGLQRRMMGSTGKLIIIFTMVRMMMLRMRMRMSMMRRRMDMVRREKVAMAIIEDETRECRGLTPLPQQDGPLPQSAS